MFYYVTLHDCVESMGNNITKNMIYLMLFQRQKDVFIDFPKFLVSKSFVKWRHLPRHAVTQTVHTAWITAQTSAWVCSLQLCTVRWATASVLSIFNWMSLSVGSNSYWTSCDSCADWKSASANPDKLYFQKETIFGNNDFFFRAVSMHQPIEKLHCCRIYDGL